MPFSQRPTPDLILLILTALIAVIVALLVAGIFVLAAINPGWDYSTALASLGNVLSLIIGTVVGYLAGKGRSSTSLEK